MKIEIIWWKDEKIDGGSNGDCERCTWRWCQSYYNQRKIKIKIKHMSNFIWGCSQAKN